MVGIFIFCRPVWCSRGGNGEVILPQVHGRVHSKELSPPSHGRCLLRHWFPSHAFHGSPRVQTQAAVKSICAQVRPINILPWRMKLIIRSVFLDCTASRSTQLRTKSNRQLPSTSKLPCASATTTANAKRLTESPAAWGLSSRGK